MRSSDSAYKYLFILGASRSGTTLVSRTLGLNPAVHATPELHLFNLVLPYLESLDALNQGNLERLVDYIYEMGFLNLRSNLKAIPLDGVSQEYSYSSLIEQCFSNRVDTQKHVELICEQTGLNIFFVEEIRERLASPLFLLMKRDIRAILASQVYRYRLDDNDASGLGFSDYLRVKVSGNVFLQLLLFRGIAKRVRKLSSDKDVILVSYEELLRQPKEVMSNVCEFLGIEFTESMLKVGRTGSSHAKESDHAGFDIRRANEWVEDRSLQSAYWLAGKIYPDFVYAAPFNHKANPFQIIKYFLEMVVYSPIAFILSMKSSTRLLDLMKRRFS